MKSSEEKAPSRREFLAAVTAVPAMAGSLAVLPASTISATTATTPGTTTTKPAATSEDAATVAYAEHRPPYLALEQVIIEGHDEFPAEKAAIEIEDKLQTALVSGD